MTTLKVFNVVFSLISSICLIILVIQFTRMLETRNVPNVTKIEYLTENTYLVTLPGGVSNVDRR